MARFKPALRNERFPASHRLLLQTTGPVAVREIVNTVDISLHGARVLARSKLQAKARGTVELLDIPPRPVPCRVVWQDVKSNEQGCYEVGLELGLELGTRMSLWDILVSENKSEEPAVESGHAPPEVAPIASLIGDVAGKAGDQTSIQLWSSLVQLLEARGLFTRDDLIETLRTIGK